MPGFWDVAGFFADLLGSRAERRRNAIEKLEKRQAFIERTFSNDLADEYDRNKRKLERLYDETKNS